VGIAETIKRGYKIMIRIFKRKCWRVENSAFVPFGGARKTTVQHVDTEEEAREICRPHNLKQPEFGKVGYFNFQYYEYENA
jgi:hypothetical protein